MAVTTTAHLASDVRAAVWALAESPVDREHFSRCTARMPARFQRAVLARYSAAHTGQGYQAANVWLDELAESFTAGRLDLAGSDSDIVDQAERRALAVSRLLADGGTTTAEALRVRLERYARAHGVRAPQAKHLQGLCQRMTSAHWWRRALRREVVREIERQAVRLGLVHKRASIYASTEAVERRKEQHRRLERYLEATEAESSGGDVFTLAELASRNVSNPKIRRTELMVRMRGFEEFAARAGHVGMFYTATCPSRMHAVLASSCQPNPKHDGTTPRQAQAYLRREWAKVRAALDRRDVYPYGVRVAEPHHDGTPHWHLLLFMPAGVEPLVSATMRRYFCAADAGELATDTARQARFHVVKIDAEKGSATGYIAKYVAKNIDALGVGADLEGEEGTADAGANVSNVEAWASTWGIRQFQQIGGPGVTIWRELRRLREAPQLALFDDFWQAADSHTWRDFVTRMGGASGVRRRDRPLKLWRCHTDKLNEYGEEAAPLLEGVQHAVLEHCRTRFESWQIHPASERRARSTTPPIANSPHGRHRSVSAPSAAVVAGGVFRLSWTRGNNCTEPDLQRDFQRSLRALGPPP